MGMLKQCVIVISLLLLSIKWWILLQAASTAALVFPLTTAKWSFLYFITLKTAIQWITNIHHYYITPWRHISDFGFGFIFNFMQITPHQPTDVVKKVTGNLDTQIKTTIICFAKKPYLISCNSHVNLYESSVTLNMEFSVCWVLTTVGAMKRSWYKHDTWQLRAFAPKFSWWKHIPFLETDGVRFSSGWRHWRNLIWDTISSNWANLAQILGCEKSTNEL